MRFSVYLLLFISIGLNADVYKWKENGRVIYSDQANPNGKKKKLKLPEITSYKAPKAGPVIISKEKSNKAAFPYQLSVLSPSPEQTYTGANALVQLEFASKPGIVTHAGHTIEYRIGAKTETTNQLQTSLGNIDRGSHVLTARIIDHGGKVLSNTVTLSFHVKRNSINIRKNLKKNNFLAP